MLMAVHGSAVYHAAALQHIFRNGSERAAGGRVLPDGVIPVPGGEGSGQMSRRTALLQNWAQPGTASAMDAFFQIHFREIKASFVPDHRNGVMGTACGAGGTAGAAAPLCQLRGKTPGRKRRFRRIGPVFQRCLQIIQRILPGGSQSRFGSFPVNGVQQLRRIPLTDDPVGKTQPAQDAHRPGPFRGGQLRRGDRGEKGPVELDGEHRAMEGIGDNIGGILEQAQKFRRTGIHDLLRLGIDLLADTTKLHHRQSRLLMEPFQIGRQRAGTADAVAEDVAALEVIGRVIGHGVPLVRRQQQGGVQHHRGVLPGDIPDDGAPLSLPGGEVGKAIQIALQLRLHPLRDGRNTEGRCVGNAALLGKRTEKHRVEPAVREDLGVPDLVAAGEDQVIGQRPPGQLVKAPIAAIRDPQMVPAELLKPPVTLRQRLIVQGRVSVMGGGTQAGGPLEQGVVLIDEVVNDLAVPAKALHSPLCGRRLK